MRITLSTDFTTFMPILFPVETKGSFQSLLICQKCPYPYHIGTCCIGSIAESGSLNYVNILEANYAIYSFCWALRLDRTLHAEPSYVDVDQKWTR